jgi:hypothetical protein
LLIYWNGAHWTAAPLPNTVFKAASPLAMTGS